MTREERQLYGKVGRSLKDGDYVYTQETQGVYYKGGIIVDRDHESDESDQWQREA